MYCNGVKHFMFLKSQQNSLRRDRWTEHVRRTVDGACKTNDLLCNLSEFSCLICCVCSGLHIQGESIDQFEVQRDKLWWHVCACACSCFFSSGFWFRVHQSVVVMAFFPRSLHGSRVEVERGVCFKCQAVELCVRTPKSFSEFRLDEWKLSSSDGTASNLL